MKKLAKLAFLLFIGGAIGCVIGPDISSAEELRISDLSGGMWSDAPANKIPDNAAAFLENVFTDTGGLFETRHGFNYDSTAPSCDLTSVVAIGGSSTPVQGVFGYTSPSGVDYLIVISSGYGSIKIRNSPIRAPCTPCVSVTNFGYGGATPSTSVVRGAQVLGKLFLTDGTHTPGYYSATTDCPTFTSLVSSAPKGMLIAPWRNRVVIANTTGAVSSVYFSADGDGENWTLGGNPTDAFVLTVGGFNDGNSVRCLQNYGDDIIVGKERSLWKISGFDQADVTVRKISSDYGCADQGSVQEKEGSLLLQYKTGVMELTGESAKIISNPIRDIVNSVLQNNVFSSTPIPSASAVYDGRYWLAVSTLSFSTSTFCNQKCLVFQRNRGWTTVTLASNTSSNQYFNGPMLVWKDFNFYVSMIFTGSGNLPLILKYNPQSNNFPDFDLSLSYAATVITKRYDAGAPMQYKDPRDLWLSSEGKSAWTHSGAATPQWSTSLAYNGTTTYALLGGSSTLGTETAIVDKMPIPSTGTAASFYDIQFKIEKPVFANNGHQAPRLNDALLRYSLKELK